MSNLRTPLYDWHVSHGARMVPFAGWDMPVQYQGIIPEHQAVRTSCGLFDVSHMARINFTGPGSETLLEHVFTNSVATMKENQVRYGLLCDEGGGILDDVLVYHWRGGHAMVANGANREKVLAWLEKQAVGMEVLIADTTLDTAMIAVQGPKSVEICTDVFGNEIAELQYYHGMATQYQHQDCILSRTGYTGEDGFEIITPASLAVAVWDELIKHEATACGLGARDTLRLEAAMPLYGHELTEAINPIQAGLKWAVKFSKEFVGKTALQKAVEKVDQPKRVGLILEGKRAAREGCNVLVDGQPIGTISSGSYTPTLEKSIAMAYIHPEHSTEGNSVMIDIRGTEVPAKVVVTPFYKR